MSERNGYAGVKEHGLERFARAFVDDGFVVLVHESPRLRVQRWLATARRRPVAADRRLAARDHSPRDRPAAWENTVTGRSNRAARMYAPGVWVGRVSPTPLLMVVGLNDTITVTDLALATYERALEPKRLQLLPGGHFDAYLTGFPEASGAARTWFRTHLT